MLSQLSLFPPVFLSVCHCYLYISVVEDEVINKIIFCFKKKKEYETLISYPWVSGPCNCFT